jgi:uncharacterized protein (TIGR02246 family)
MDDVNAIRNLIARYAHAADDGEGKELAALFTPEGGLESLGLAITGQERLAALITSIYDRHLRHLQLNTDVRLDGDSATATSDLVVLGLVPDQGWQIVACGRYEDQLVKQQGDWLFERRVITWQRATPTAVLDQLRGLMSAAG